MPLKYRWNKKKKNKREGVGKSNKNVRQLVSNDSNQFDELECTQIDLEI